MRPPCWEDANEDNTENEAPGLHRRLGDFFRNLIWNQNCLTMMGDFYVFSSKTGDIKNRNRGVLGSGVIRGDKSHIIVIFIFLGVMGLLVMN